MQCPWTSDYSSVLLSCYLKREQWALGRPLSAGEEFDSTKTTSFPRAEQSSNKGGRTPMQILGVHWRDLPLCK